MNNKKIKSIILASFLAVIMTLSLVLPLFAAEGYCTITTSSNPALVNTSYPSLQNALAAVGSGQSATIRLDTDISTGSFYTISDKTITINPNQYSLTFYGLTINSNATLTILGSFSTTYSYSAINVDRATLNVVGSVHAISNGYVAISASNMSQVRISGDLNSQGAAILNSASSISVNGNVSGKGASYPTIEVGTSGLVEVLGDVNSTSSFALQTDTTSTRVSVGNINNSSYGGINSQGGRIQVNGSINTNTTGIMINGSGTVFVDGFMNSGSTYIASSSGNMAKEPYPATTYSVGARTYYDYTRGSWHVYVAKLPNAKDKRTELVYTYTSVVDAKSYQIQRSNQKTKGFKVVGSSTVNYFCDYHLKAGTTYYYRVRSLRVVNGKNVYSKYSPAVKLDTDQLPIPSVGNDVTIIPTTYGLNFKWNNQVTAIQIYYATSNTNKTKWQVVTTANNNFTLRKLNANTKYFYKLRYVYQNGSTSYGPFSTVGNITTTNISINVAPYINNQYTEARISYLTGDGDYYQIYRSTNKTKAYALVGLSSITTFTDYYLTANTTYYYKVRSVKVVDGKNIYGKYYPVITTKTVSLVKPRNITVTAGSASIRFQWNDLDNMQAIQIYYATSNNKKTKWSVVTVAANDFTLRKLAGNKKYFYKIRYVHYSGSTSYGPFSDVSTIVTN